MAALLLHRLLIVITKRASARTQVAIDNILVDCLKRPTLWLFIVLGIAAVQPSLPVGADAAALLRRVLGLIAPALLGWLAIALLGAGNAPVQRRYDINVADNLDARRRRTRPSILSRHEVRSGEGGVGNGCVSTC